MDREINRSPGEIPEGISFGNKVVKLPNTSRAFDKAIWRQACIPNNPKVLYGSYTWVEKGENLIEFTILTPKTGIPIIDFFKEKNYNKIYIRSPVCGLLLHDEHYFEAYDHTSLLLPDYEEPASSGSYMFSDLCDFCWDHREFIFYKSSGVGGESDDKSLSQSFEEQKNRSCELVDAMPEFKSYFQEARTKYPQLRPYLKHLYAIQEQ